MAIKELRVHRLDWQKGLLPLAGEYRPVHPLLCDGDDVVRVMIEDADGTWVHAWDSPFPDMVPYEDRNRAAQTGGGFHLSTPIKIVEGN